MRLTSLSTATLLAACSAACAAAQTPARQTAPPTATTQAAPRVPSSSLRSSMDPAADPCADFYQYACGSWMKNNPIPADQSSWGRFHELYEQNQSILRTILEQAAVPNPNRDAVTQKIGDYYAACMDEKAVDAAGAKPIQPEMARIDAIRTKADLVAEISRLHAAGVANTFVFGSAPDLHNAEMVIANFNEGGLSLPDRDYYTEAKHEPLRGQYAEHVARMFKLLGDDDATAAREAQTVLRMETQLAQHTMTRVERRKPENRDHKMTVAAFNGIAPGIETVQYVALTGAPSFSDLNVSNPEFFKNVNAMLDTAPLADWKTYLRWHLVHHYAPNLSAPFVAEDFAFFGKTLLGQQENRARWKRCVTSTDAELGEALGQPYVARAFGPDAKERMLKTVDALENSLRNDFTTLSWMGPETRQQAIEKLALIRNKIGYPEKWRDYSSVKVVRTDYVGDRLAAESFEVRRNWNKIGKPLDKSEWRMTPPTVNAYYSPPENTINFPAGILQPPFFDQTRDDAANFGGIGAVIGHELTHGFDDQGSKFDGHGNLHNWFTPSDLAEFRKRTECVASEYESFPVTEDTAGQTHLNGHLTLGENTADNGGVRIALAAFEAMANDKPADRDAVDGFTPEQRFFLGYAQLWCENRRPEASKVQAATDPHSPGRYRVDGVMQNSAEFQKAFGCKTGQPMVRENACRVW